MSPYQNETATRQRDGIRKITNEVISKVIISPERMEIK